MIFVFEAEVDDGESLLYVEEEEGVDYGCEFIEGVIWETLSSLFIDALAEEFEDWDEDY